MGIYIRNSEGLRTQGCHTLPVIDGDDLEIIEILFETFYRYLELSITLLVTTRPVIRFPTPGVTKYDPTRVLIDSKNRVRMALD